MRGVFRYARDNPRTKLSLKNKARDVYPSIGYMCSYLSIDYDIGLNAWLIIVRMRRLFMV